MDGQQVLVQHAQALQVLDGTLTPAGVGVLLLLLGLGHMHVDAHAVLVGQLLGAHAQLVGVVEDGPQAEPHLHPAVGGVVVLLQVRDLLLQLLLHGALPDLGQAVAAVHDGLGQLAPQAGLLGGPGHAGDELSAGLGEGGDTGADELQGGHQGGDVGVLLGHVALIGPHPVVEPGDEVHVVAHAPADLLGGVDVGVDKAGQDVLAAQLNDFRVGLHQGGVHLAHSDNLVVLHQYAAAVIYGVIGVHREDVAVFQISLRHCRCLLILPR